MSAPGFEISTADDGHDLVITIAGGASHSERILKALREHLDRILAEEAQLDVIEPIDLEAARDRIRSHDSIATSTRCSYCSAVGTIDSILPLAQITTIDGLIGACERIKQDDKLLNRPAIWSALKLVFSGLKGHEAVIRDVGDAQTTHTDTRTASQECITLEELESKMDMVAEAPARCTSDRVRDHVSLVASMLTRDGSMRTAEWGQLYIWDGKDKRPDVENYINAATGIMIVSKHKNLGRTVTGGAIGPRRAKLSPETTRMASKCTGRYVLGRHYKSEQPVNSWFDKHIGIRPMLARKLCASSALAGIRGYDIQAMMLVNGHRAGTMAKHYQLAVPMRSDLDLVLKDPSTQVIDDDDASIP